jgi:long-chain acyl-CoA synthetase
MEYPTLPQRLLEAIYRYDSPRAQIYKAGSQWEDISAQELLRRIAGVARTLANLGVREGDRVAVFAPNCPEWHVVDFAALGLGAVTVPIYFRESPDRMTYILNHAEASAVFVSGEEQTARLLGIHAQVPSVRHVIIANGGASGVPNAGGNGVPSAAETAPGAFAGSLVSYEDAIAQAGDADLRAYRERAESFSSSQLASIIYTSGTTGEPKGVMLTHANFVFNCIASFERFGLGPTDLALSFLPLSHVYERLVDYGYLFRGVPVAYVARMEDVPQALLEVRPTVAAAVPRFYEKLYANIQEKGTHTAGVRRRLFDWAMNVARRAVPWRAYGRSGSLALRLQWGIANKLVYQKFRDGVGGRIIMFISGGAPLARELAEFFTAVAVPVYQGYGLTETSPVIATNLPGANHIGTVGLPVPGIEARFAPDGELQVRGPLVMQGYYKKPDETRAVLAPDGWLSTGDIGHFDPAGFLIITDRKKELLKTAGGKLVAPAPIENALKTSPYIASAVLIGDQRRFISALIVPNFTSLQARAREAGRALGSPKEACNDPWVHELIDSEIKRLTANLANYETIKRFALIERDFTFDGGELTFTLKLKRRVINERYAGVIDQLYAEASPART